MGTALFYKELGKLLYAIAIADETVTEQEKAAVSKLISTRKVMKTALDPMKHGSRSSHLIRLKTVMPMLKKRFRNFWTLQKRIKMN